jgi:hypothetical protein
MTRSNTRLQAGAHRFLMRRMEHALLYGIADDDMGTARAQRVSLSVGLVLALGAMAVCRVLPSFGLA